MHDVETDRYRVTTAPRWSEELRGIVARAADLRERATWPCFVPLPMQDDEALAYRRQRWCQAAAGGDELRFAALLASRGLSADACRRAVSDVSFDPAFSRPRWTDDLRRLLKPDARSGAARATDTATGNAGAAGAVGALLTLPESLLDRTASRLRVNIDAPARAAMLLQLRRRWQTVLDPLLTHTITSSDVLLGHRGAVGATVAATYFAAPPDELAAWLECFRTYPVAARHVAVLTRHWWSALRECLWRLSADLPRLEPSTAVERLSLRAFRGDAGDTHERGRAVAVLTLSNGQKWVYKPRELTIANCYSALVQLVTSHGAMPALESRTVVTRGSYAWESFVETEPCESDAEVRDFYRRLGMLAGVTAFVGATDCTTDNVLVSRDHPVLIDVETLLTPRLESQDTLSPAERQAEAAAADVPLQSGIISAKVEGMVGWAAADVGALACASQRRAPFPVSLALGASAEGAGEFPGNSAIPILHGVAMNPADYWEDVRAGYLDSMQTLRASAADGSLLTWCGTLEDVRVRVILRDTHIYDRLQRSSLRADRLTDGLLRDFALEPVHRAGHRDVRVSIAEQEALRHGDIPVFYARADRCHLELDDGDRVADYFPCSAARVLGQRILTLATPTPDAAQARSDAIDTALFVLDARRVVATDARAVPVLHREHRPVAVATELLRPVLDRAFRAADGDLAWLGVSYRPEHERWHLGVLPPTVYSGTAGLGVACAALGRETGDAAWRIVARAIAESVFRALCGDAWRFRPQAPWHWAWSGSWAALATIGEVSGDQHVIALARHAYERAHAAPAARWAEHGGIAASTRAGAAVMPQRATACIDQTWPERDALPWTDRWPLRTLPTDLQLRKRHAGQCWYRRNTNDTTPVPVWNDELAAVDDVLTADGSSAATTATLAALVAAVPAQRAALPWARVADVHHVCALDGRAGLAYALLRSCNPVRYPSLRTAG